MNIDGKTMEETKLAMKNPTRHTFDRAADHVYTLLLKKDCYPRLARYFGALPQSAKEALKPPNIFFYQCLILEEISNPVTLHCTVTNLSYPNLLKSKTYPFHFTFNLFV